VAGTPVTVVGQNFSGAAGNLQVFFRPHPGDRPSWWWTTATPSRSRPPVRGPWTSASSPAAPPRPTPRTSRATIFGYGISATNANDLFTYGVAAATCRPPWPPRERLAAVVTVSGTTLSVLGADDGGEAALTYTWAAIVKRAGAADPTFGRQRQQRGQEHDGHLQRRGQLHPPGGDPRRRRPDRATSNGERDRRAVPDAATDPPPGSPPVPAPAAASPGGKLFPFDKLARTGRATARGRWIPTATFGFAGTDQVFFHFSPPG